MSGDPTLELLERLRDEQERATERFREVWQRETGGAPMAGPGGVTLRFDEAGVLDAVEFDDDVRAGLDGAGFLASIDSAFVEALGRPAGSSDANAAFVDALLDRLRGGVPAPEVIREPGGDLELHALATRPLAIRADPGRITAIPSAELSERIVRLARRAAGVETTDGEGEPNDG